VSGSFPGWIQGTTPTPPARRAGKLMAMENTDFTAPTTTAPSTERPTPPAAPARRPFRIYRSRTDRMLGGVCGGLAENLGVDVALLRIALVAITVLGVGITVPIYIAAWILAPEGP